MLAVTTRNRLRSTRFSLPMLYARRLISQQLGRTPGLLRYAGAIASPTEFLTLTVWEDREAMQAFMGSGAHERFLWAVTRWTASFWAMRWEPTTAEHGRWGATALADGCPSPPPRSPLVLAGLLPPWMPRAGPTGPRRDIGPVEPRGCGYVAVLAWLKGPRVFTVVPALRQRLAQEQATGGALVRWAVGLDWPAQALAITVWRDEPGRGERAMGLLAQEARADWTMAWKPGDYEVGHWDGLRLRRAHRSPIRPAGQPSGGGA
jgi:hypothetical protein